MRRRGFITLLGGAAVWPLAAHAQQATPPSIGFMGESTPEGQRQWVAAFVQRLGERGWSEGRNVAIEYRWAAGRNERFAEIVAELVRLKVDVIVTQGTPAVLAAKQATSVIPVVFAIAGNPVANGLVASLARPGGNVTGLTNEEERTLMRQTGACNFGGVPNRQRSGAHRTRPGHRQSVENDPELSYGLVSCAPMLCSFF